MIDQESEAMVELPVSIENHSHNGQPCKKGDIITVSPQVAEMLKKAWADVEKQ